MRSPAIAKDIEEVRIEPFDHAAGGWTSMNDADIARLGFPELDPLVPLWHHAEESQVPAPIRLRAMRSTPARCVGCASFPAG